MIINDHLLRPVLKIGPLSCSSIIFIEVLSSIVKDNLYIVQDLHSQFKIYLCSSHYRCSILL